MSEEKIEQKTPEKKKKVKRKSRLIRYFREMRSELKKVVWPTRKQIINNSAIALVVMAVSGIAIWGVDKIAEVIISAILTLGGS